MTPERLAEVRKALKEADAALTALGKELRDADAAGLDVKDMRAQYTAALESYRKMLRVYG